MRYGAYPPEMRYVAMLCFLSNAEILSFVFHFHYIMKSSVSIIAFDTQTYVTHLWWTASFTIATLHKYIYKRNCSGEHFIKLTFMRTKQQTKLNPS